MKSCLMEIIDEMVQNYDIRFEDEMTPTEYKKMIIKGIDKKFEKMYNQYKESEEQSMTVILIHEDNHGLLGVAKDYENAIDYLIQNQWLNTDTEVYSTKKEEYTSLRELKITIENIRKMGIDKFNELFDGVLYLDVDNVWEM